MRSRLVASVALTLPIAAAAGLAAVACDDGQAANVGVTEPLLVHQSQFIPGPLPGLPPFDGGAPTSADGGLAALAPREVTALSFASPFILPGAAGLKFSGQAATDTAAVAVGLEGLGSGYWIVPVQAPDPMFPGQSDFSFTADFDLANPPGRRPLLLVGLDSHGVAGRQYSTTVCLESRIPDNKHECNAANAVPPAVFTLQWDANFDLDLHVLTPGGVDVNPKNRTTVPEDAGPPPGMSSWPDAGAIDRDSLGSCVADGLRQEDLVFTSPPPGGTYEIYVDPFASCGQPAVRFSVIISELGADGALHPTFTRSGELLQSQANGGASRGMFVLGKTYE